jgi:O-acetyl-ADP-ribose deacetylase (regulator of RNase III)
MHWKGEIKMKTIEGDLLKLAKEGKFDVIVHGCNCFHTFGAGIAKQILKEFPEAYSADCTTIKGSARKLGDYSSAEVLTPYGRLVIVNAYTQFGFERAKNNTDYTAVQSVFNRIKQNFSGNRIGYPAIGSGLGGGNWGIIYDIICKELKGEDHTFVAYR